VYWGKTDNRFYFDYFILIVFSILK
jgi:hypothetical protein